MPRGEADIFMITYLKVSPAPVVDCLSHYVNMVVAGALSYRED